MFFDISCAWHQHGARKDGNHTISRLVSIFVHSTWGLPGVAFSQSCNPPGWTIKQPIASVNDCLLNTPWCKKSQPCWWAGEPSCFNMKLAGETIRLMAEFPVLLRDYMTHMCYSMRKWKGCHGSTDHETRSMGPGNMWELRMASDPY